MKYKFGSLERLLCPGNVHTNFIANLEQIMEILKKICRSGDSIATFWQHFYDITESCLGDWRLKGDSHDRRGLRRRKDL